MKMQLLLILLVCHGFRGDEKAQGVLNNWYGSHYRVIPQSSGPQPIMAPPINNNSIPLPNYITAFPNPAKESVQFNYSLPKGIEQAQVSVFDLNGSLVVRLNLFGAIGTVAWDTNGQSAGIYYYIARMDGLDEAPRKLVLIK